MSRRDSLLLRATVLWTFFIWVVFIKNIVGDKTRTTGFKAIHVTLAVISMVFAVAVWRVASRNRRLARQEAPASRV